MSDLFSMAREDVKVYREMRAASPMSRASYVWDEAKAEVRLRVQEENGAVRFRIVGDLDYSVTDCEDERAWSPHDWRVYLAKLNRGALVSLGVICEVPNTCEHCGHGMNGWHEVGSLWAIVVESEDDSHVRDVCRELAFEADVI